MGLNPSTFPLKQKNNIAFIRSQQLTKGAKEEDITGGEGGGNVTHKYVAMILFSRFLQRRKNEAQGHRAHLFSPHESGENPVSKH